MNSRKKQMITDRKRNRTKKRRIARHKVTEMIVCLDYASVLRKIYVLDVCERER